MKSLLSSLYKGLPCWNKPTHDSNLESWQNSLVKIKEIKHLFKKYRPQSQISDASFQALTACLLSGSSDLYKKTNEVINSITDLNNPRINSRALTDGEITKIFELVEAFDPENNIDMSFFDPLLGSDFLAYCPRDIAHVVNTITSNLLTMYNIYKSSEIRTNPDEFKKSVAQDVKILLRNIYAATQLVSNKQEEYAKKLLPLLDTFLPLIKELNLEYKNHEHCNNGYEYFYKNKSIKQIQTS